MGSAPDVRTSGLAAVSRAVVSVAADLVTGVERVMVGDANVRTARGNAWAAVQADRARAQARKDMQEMVEALLQAPPRGAAGRVPAAARTTAGVR